MKTKKWFEALDPELVRDVAQGKLNLDLLGVDAGTKLDADQSAYIAHLGHLYFLQGQYREAELLFLGLRAIEPGNSGHASALGALYLAEQRHDDSLLCLNCALELDPSNAEARFHRAEVYLAMGNSESAKADLDAVSKLPGPTHQELVKKANGVLQLLMRASKKR